MLAAILLGAACVEPQHGSRIIANFQSLRPPGEVSVGMGAPPLLSPHYELWATIREDSVVQLLSFDVAPVVDPNSPCLMYDSDAEQAYRGEVVAGEPIMAPLPDCTAATAPPNCIAVAADKAWIQSRAILLAKSVFAVTSVSDGLQGETELDLTKCIPHGATTAVDCWLDHAAIVAGTFELIRNNMLLEQDVCTEDPASVPNAGRFCLEPSSGRVTLDAAAATGALMATYRAHLVSGAPQTDPLTWSHADRLRVCALPMASTINRVGNSNYDPNFYIGNFIQLSAPRTGQLYGLVDAIDPNAGLPLGGIQVVVPFGLGQATEIFITVEDHTVGVPDPNIGNRTAPDRRGPIVLGGITTFGTPGTGNSLMTADLIAPANITIGAFIPGGHMSIYNNLDDNTEQF